MARYLLDTIVLSHLGDSASPFHDAAHERLAGLADADEVTLSVLGFTNINTPTIGVMIYWANQHTALVAGVRWWIFFPVALVVMTFIGLFLLAVSMNEYIDPRSRLSRMRGAT